MPMKVAHISYHYQPVRGGQEIYVDNLQKVLLNAGHSSSVFQAGRGRWPGNVRAFFTIPFIGRFLPNLNHYVFLALLFMFGRKALKRADVIIAHYALVSLPIWDQRKKTIVLSHGIEWRTDKIGMSDRIRRRVATHAFGRFTTVANDTEYFRYFGLALEPATGFFKEVARGKWFIPNCVDTDIFKKNVGLKQLRGKRSSLVPRQICFDRGIDLAIEAFGLFSKVCREFEMHIVGGPTVGQYFDQCARLVKRLNLVDKVSFKGFVGHSDMPSYYSSATATLIPTRRREGSSLSALESMSCGTPVVSTNVGGLKDLPTVKALVEPQDMADKLVRVVSEHDRISAEQAEYVRGVFNMRNWADAWNSVVGSISATRPLAT